MNYKAYNLSSIGGEYTIELEKQYGMPLYAVTVINDKGEVEEDLYNVRIDGQLTKQKAQDILDGLIMNRLEYQD